MDQATTAVTSSTPSATPSQACCFNMISRWFKRRKDSIDINGNHNLFPSCKGDFFYTNMGVKTSKSKSLVCNSLITDPPLVPPVNEVRRASILVTEPKVKTSIQYYKKRVSFADILDVRKEFDISGGPHCGLHEDEEDHPPDDQDDACRENDTDDHHEDVPAGDNNNKKTTKSKSCNQSHRHHTPYESTAEPDDPLLFIS